METAGNLERTLFASPELDCGDYTEFPGASEEELAAMESAFLEDTSAIRLFVFIRENASGMRYVELYVWDQLLYPEIYERFIIAEGFQMREESEEDFLYYVKRGLQPSNVSMDWLFYYVTSYFPEWHYLKYDEDELEEALEHMYYASHRSGAREILYKAGLVNIAYHLEELPDYNIIGTTPESIVGYGLPLKLLRILNQEELIDKLFDIESLRLSGEVFRRFSDHIKSPAVTRGQWKYLEELVLPEGLFSGENFNRTLYERLSEEDSEFTLRYYKKFFQLQYKYPELRKMKLPDPEKVEDLMRDLDNVNYSVDGKPSVNDQIRQRKKRGVYEYAGKEFLVVLPKDALDICKEAIAQGNCLMEYVYEHAYAETTILFLRRAELPEKSFVTMEVSGDSIQQVYARYNELPGIEVYHFLENYAREKELLYDPYELIIENTEGMGSCEYSEELWAYAENYENREETEGPS